MPISLSGSLNLSGSLTTTGTITATTLVVQTITSSISSITGSTNFGSLSSNTHVFTGSLLVTGSSHNLLGNVIVVAGAGDTLLLRKTTTNIPALTFSGSTSNTTFEGGNNLNLYTGGTGGRLYVSSSGLVGIGTSSPNAPLNVVKDDGVAAGLHILADFNRNTSSAELILGYYGDGTNVTTNAVYSANTLPLAFYAGAAERMRINNSGQITTPSQPAFYAYGVSGGTYASGNYWIFPSTQINRGSHYNASNGVFTVPVAGTYLFAFGHIMGTSATVYRWYLRINNSNTGAGPIIQLRIDRQGYSTASYGWNVSKTAILNLAAGDTVRIYSAADDGGAFHPGSDAATEEYPYFSGYLLG
jgi:hypothetical protein